MDPCFARAGAGRPWARRYLTMNSFVATFILCPRYSAGLRSTPSSSSLLSAVIEHICASTGHDGSTACTVLSSRWTIVLSVSLFVALPLSRIEKIHSLAASSVLAGLTVLAVGVLVVVRGSTSFGGTPTATTLNPIPTPGGATPPDSNTRDLVLARWSFVGWMLGIPISIFSLGNHVQIVPVFLELSPAVQSTFHRPIFVAVITCLCLYLLTGVFGYAAFRDDTKGDVLLDFPVTDAASDTAKALLAIHVLLAYPVLLWPCRKCFGALVGVLRDQYSSSNSGNNSNILQSSDGGSHADSNSSSISSPGGGRSGGCMHRMTSALAGSTTGQTALLVIGTSVLAVAFPQVAVIFGLVGSTCATYQIYGIPGLLLVKWADAWSGRFKSGVLADGAASPVAGSAGLKGDHGPPASSPTHSTQLLVDPERVSLLSAASASGVGNGNGGGGVYGVWTASDSDSVWSSVPLLYKSIQSSLAATTTAATSKDGGRRGRKAASASSAASGSAAVLGAEVDRDGQLLPVDDQDGGSRPLSYLPRNPRTLRFHGYLLQTIGALVTVIGTGTYIYSTWIAAG